MKISINQPCHENWDSMKPNDKGAFCLSCKKNVVDFSSKTITQIKDFFNELPASNNVCGRFKEKQLTELSLDHFLNEFMSWKFLKKAAVIFYFVLGISMLSSCSSFNDDHERMGDVEAVPDTTQAVKRVNDTVNKDIVTLGEPAIVQDSLKKE